MSTIVTYNKGSQGAPFQTSPPADPSTGSVWFHDFLGSAAGFTLASNGFAVKAEKSGVIYIATEGTAASTAISVGEVFSDLADGESFAFNARVRATSTRANADNISFGIAEDVAATIGSTATHVGFHVTQGGSASADNIAVKYDDDTTAALSTNFTPATTPAIATYDATGWNDYGFQIRMDGTTYRVDYFVNGVRLGTEHRATATFGDELFIAIFSAADKGVWEIDYTMVAGPRAS